jgi:hemoglobin/transferrin/lactoferrin receptor protein
MAGTGMWLDAYLRGESSSQLKEPGTSRDVLEDKNNWLTLNMAGGVKYGSREQYQLALELHNLNDESYITSTENLYAAERSVAVKFTVEL